MPAVLITILSFIAKYLVVLAIVKVASLVVFTTIGAVLIDQILDTAMDYLGDSGQYLWFVQLAGFDVGLSAIGSAFILRGMFKNWSLGPSALITGGS
ncbi:DUF2523 family protein [Halomonas beimenensis]|uniref:DUF2523 domain-containing protein n=1 Tax=Halomonas beimenensis TaxID=475662 RepID=A0A291PA03_9GAMM|nr:DUF2523 family protein [Halomonas beimenensis]ATJ83699.1 hypothetical protein BEI_2712 [Halomonas beimenensis]